MSEPNHELLRAYMMRGAATGPAEAEKPPVKYCAGKLDNGRPCRIVMLGDEDYCMRHKKEIEALEAGAPLPISRAERLQEDGEMAAEKKKICCKHPGCIRGVKNLGDACKKHEGLEDQAQAGIVIHDVNNLENKPVLKTVTSDNMEPVEVHKNMDSDTSFGVFAVGMGDDTENLAQAPSAIKTETLPDPAPACLACEGPVAGQDLFCHKCVPDDFRNAPAVAAPPQEEINPIPLILELLHQSDTVPPNSVILTFTADEIERFRTKGVTTEHLHELALMFLDGSLARRVFIEDPLAKSRVRPGGI